MDYSENAAKAYANQALGGSVGSHSLQQAPAPRTLSSAASRIESLNERLLKATEALSIISAQIGAISPVVGGNANAKNSPSPNGAVHRLNDSADFAHNQLAEVENLIASISRALG